jgi:hypothetical protein
MSAQNGQGSLVSAELLLELREALAASQGWRDAAGIAEHLGVKPQTVQNRTGPNVPPEDRIPFHRLPGGEKRFYVPEVDEWLLGRAA